MNRGKPINRLMDETEFRIRARMKEYGFDNAHYLSKFCKANEVVIGLLLCGKYSPIRERKRGWSNKSLQWRLDATKMAYALGCEPEDLWPGMMQEATRRLLMKDIDAFLASKRASYCELNEVESEPNEIRDIIMEEFEKLDETEKAIVRMRFGMKPYAKEYTLNAIGKKFGYTRERIRQIVRDTCEAIRFRYALRTKRDPELLCVV